MFVIFLEEGKVRLYQLLQSVTLHWQLSVETPLFMKPWVAAHPAHVLDLSRQTVPHTDSTAALRWC